MLFQLHPEHIAECITLKELLKSIHICQGYRKNKFGTFFMDQRVAFGRASWLIGYTGAVKCDEFHNQSVAYPGDRGGGVVGNSLVDVDGRKYEESDVQ